MDEVNHYLTATNSIFGNAKLEEKGESLAAPVIRWLQRPALALHGTHLLALDATSGRSTRFNQEGRSVEIVFQCHAYTEALGAFSLQSALE